MAQRTAGHFATPAPLKGTGSRNYFRFGEWKIGHLLPAFFAAIVLLMIVGDVIAVLQLNRVETRARRFYEADQKSLAIMHVYVDVVTFRDTLTGLAHDQNAHEFASRATALRDNFLRDVTHAQQTLSSAPDVSQEPTILIRLETVRAALPSQVDTLLELVRGEDWQAVRFRLAGQVQPLIALSSSLVADVEQEVAQERARALESIQRTRRQLYLVLPTTALLILLMAAMLGWYATRRISRPLAQLDAGAQALARGEFGYQVELRRNDELADLARAFNYAAQQLQKLYDDIKRSEAYLQESKAKLEEAQRIAHVGYWEWDLTSNRVICLDETYRIYGLLPQEYPIDIAAVRKMIHPEDLEFVFRVAEEAVRGGLRTDVEHRIIRPSGELRTVHSQGDLKKDASGRPCQMFGTVQDITDRKRTEETLELMSRDLQESKNMLEEAQRIAHVGYWLFDLGNDELTWSDETYRIFGLRPQERPMNVAAFQEMIHPEDQEFLLRATQEVRGGGRPDVELRIVRPSGEVRIIHSPGAVKRDLSGQSRQTFGIVQDITERKRAEEELRRSQFYLSEGQRVAHMGSWAFNATGFTYWSSELFRVHGLDPRNKPPTVEEYLALVHTEDRAFMKQGIATMLDDHLAFDFTKRIVRPDGEIRQVRCVGVPVTQGGIFQGFLGTGMDVTEQQRLTEELRLSEHYLSEGQRLAHMGSWAFNPSGCFYYWSEELFRIYGLDPQRGAPTLEQYLATVHPQDRDFMANTIKRMHAERSGCDVKKRIVRPDGEQRYIRCVGIPVLDNGVLKRFLGTAMDVTEQEQLTQELQRREAYLAEAQRLSQTGSWAWSPDQDITYWSEECYRIYEVDPVKVKPAWSLILDRVHPDDRASLEQRRKMESTQTEWAESEAEFRIVVPGGKIKHLHSIAHPVMDASGKINEVVGTVMDVTERKRVEDSLRRSESHLAEAQKLTHTGSWAWRVPDRKTVHLSEEWYHIY